MSSLSARRAWIEIFKKSSGAAVFAESLSARRAWIEMVYLALIRYLINTSLSARRAWIEITVSLILPLSGAVALRKESVDRNIVLLPWGAGGAAVALRKESVDRNCAPVHPAAYL